MKADTDHSKGADELMRNEDLDSIHLHIGRGFEGRGDQMTRREASIRRRDIGMSGKARRPGHTSCAMVCLNFVIFHA